MSRLRMMALALGIACLAVAEILLPGKAAAVKDRAASAPSRRSQAHARLRAVVRRFTGGPVSSGHPLTPRTYVVQRGDTLWGIAARVYGSGSLWRDIWKDNPSISNPSMIYAGQRLRLIGHRRAGPAAARPVITRDAVVIPPAHGSCKSNTGVGTPYNFQAIVNYLTSHGYTDNAAAGIAGNIWQESGGRADSVGTGGGGLIGFTPFIPGQDGYLGNLISQLAAVVRYDETNGSAADINAHSATPASAASWYMLQYERPYLPVANEPGRIAAAEAVARACGF